MERQVNKFEINIEKVLTREEKGGNLDKLSRERSAAEKGPEKKWKKVLDKRS